MKTLISFLALFVALSVDAASTLYVGRFVGDGAGTTNHYSSNIVDSLTLTIGGGLSSVQSGTDLTLSVNPNSAIVSLWRTNSNDGSISNINGSVIVPGVTINGLFAVNNGLTETNTGSGGSVTLFGGNVVSKNGSYFGDGSTITNQYTMTANTTATVTFNTTKLNEVQYDVSGSTIASLTINLPSATATGQILRYMTAAVCTSVTVNGTVSAGAAVTTLASNSSVAWQAINGSGSFIRIQ